MRSAIGLGMHLSLCVAVECLERLVKGGARLDAAKKAPKAAAKKAPVKRVRIK
jgi:hypothetical protein